MARAAYSLVSVMLVAACGADESDESAPSQEASFAITAPAEACPGTAEALTVGTTTIFSGSTVGRLDDSSSYCGGSGAPDALQAVKPLGEGVFAVSLSTASALSLSVNSVCNDSASVVYCRNTVQGATSLPSFAAHKNTSYFFWIDGQSGSSGDYLLTVNLTPPVCGDGFVNAPEQCDLGVANGPGSGCSPTCQVESIGTGADTCPGQLYALTSTGLHLTGTTVGFKDDIKPPPAGSCAGGGGGGGRSPDRLYWFRPKTNGTMTATAVGNFDIILSLAPYHTCNMIKIDKCSDSLTSYGATETVTDTVKKDHDYMIIVDGYGADSAGSFTLDITLKP